LRIFDCVSYYLKYSTSSLFASSHLDTVRSSEYSKPRPAFGREMNATYPQEALNRNLMQSTFVIALDFDGVLCDSAAETARSGWLAGHRLWPDRFPLPISEATIERFREVRPILKTGYDSIAMLHMLQRGASVRNMLNRGLDAVNDEIAKLGRSKDELQEVFGAVRDNWIANDFQGWLAANGFYSAPLAAAKACVFDQYIITTKQTRFASSLCKNVGLELPDSKVFGLEYGSKSSVLSGIQKKHADAQVIFVEDRLKNLLEAAVPDDRLLHRFYADWGYGTKEDRAMAEETPHVTVVDLSDFARLLLDPAPFLS
jgi:phosphoglycolate phosphatase-like HAD superfamily hydrolase